MSANSNDMDPARGEPPAPIGFDPDDARLTAYVLGALEGEEYAQVEELLERDVEARAFVDGLRSVAVDVERLYAQDGDASLLAAQRARALASPKAPSSRMRKVAGWSTLAASCLALAWAAITLRDAGSPEPARTVAMDPVMDPAATPSTKRTLDVVMPSPERQQELRALRNSTSVLRIAPPAETPALEVLSFMREQGYLGDRIAGRPDGTQTQDGPPGSETYATLPENPFRRTTEEARSTFSIDVDTASYSNARRFLTQGQLPPPDSIRIEEFINYFTYDYPQPDAGMPFSVTAEIALCPWQPEHRLVLLGVQAREVTRDTRKSANLVFLIDVSGSMNAPDKLPLLVRSMKLLAEQMDARDRIAIVVYAGSSGLVLPSTRADEDGTIVNALERLSAGGSTNGGAGIELAYRVAEENRIDGGVNRVILCTDGDFNVGVTSRDDLVRLIEQKRESGVFLSVLGFGTGNLKDATMEQLADKGNGNYAYIDSLSEARKVLVEQISGTLEVVAKDVKIQVEFNPATVGAWRLIGYENRVLAHADFNDDRKDAGDVGAGSSVTALYQVAPIGAAWIAPGVDESRYQSQTASAPAASHGDELMFLRLRYKQPDGKTSSLIETPVRTGDTEFRAASPNLRFAASVAGFAMLLKRSMYAGSFTADLARVHAQDSVGEDRGGYRREFLTLVDQARALLLK